MEFKTILTVISMVVAAVSAFFAYQISELGRYVELEARLVELEKRPIGITEEEAAKLVNHLPNGTILAWQSSERLPVGWSICDGTNGTPDLRGKFLRGVASQADLGNTGGKERHDISALEHSHDIARGSKENAMRAENGGGVITHTTKVDYLYNTYTDTSVKNSKVRQLDNLPPFYSIIFIMKN